MKRVVTECSLCGARIYGRMNRDATMRYVENQADSSGAEKIHKHEAPWWAVQKIAD